MIVLSSYIYIYIPSILSPNTLRPEKHTKFIFNDVIVLIEHK